MRLELANLLDSDRVVADDLDGLAELDEIAGYVEDERVVVVDDQDHARPGPPNASKIRLALVRVSSYSASGSDIAVMPPPAWKTADLP
jgi:hypothetical protein